MINIVAHQFRFAEHYAQYELNIPRAQWRFIDDAYRLDGISQQEVILLIAPRYHPTTSEREKFALIVEICHARRLDIKRVYLP